MKKVVLSVMVCMISLLSYATLTVPASKDSSATNAHVENMAPSGNTNSSEKMMRLFVSLTPDQYEFLRGKKMNFFERLSFKASQKRAARQLAKNSEGTGTEKFHAGGFFLGLILGLIGVLGAYIFSKDRNLRKWAWIGWGIWIVVLAVILLI